MKANYKDDSNFLVLQQAVNTKFKYLAENNNSNLSLIVCWVQTKLHE
jgi:hypothetical protein